MTTTLRLATRSSNLAMTQSRLVAEALRRLAGVRVELVALTTAGDTTPGSLAEAGGKGLFVKGIERALLDGHADLAVHSMKDVPVDPVESDDRLVIAAVPPREDRRDVLVRRDGDRPIRTLGTSSPRRAMLARLMLPGAAIVPLRGNVETRLAKVAAGEVDATLLAAAGLRRLDLLDGGRVGDLRAEVLDVDVMTPAAGQGGLAVQCRRDDEVIRDRLASIGSGRAWREVGLEREAVRLLGGDCHSAIAASAEAVSDDQTRLRLIFAEGETIRRADVTGPIEGLAALAIDHAA